ncbi:polyprenyl synthetase family protein [Luteococcus sanguinis]
MLPGDTLRAVDERVERALGELTQMWDGLAGRHADVLGDRDLPWLIRHASGGGKRIRPEMVHWGWVAAGAPESAREQVVDLGAAFELLHLFALVHDDVMDRSELRRGQFTSHAIAREAHIAANAQGDPVAFGDSIAVLVGDLVHSEATLLVAELPAQVRTAWRQMMVELVLGQRRDLTGAALGRRDQEHALEVARMKSGSYTVSGPLRMGAMLGDASPELLDSLSRYAHHAGEAFGLRDDLLGMWGDPEHTGKSDHDDLAAGKATVLLALAHDRLTTDGQQLLACAGSLSPDEETRLRDEMAGCGVREAVEDLITREVEQACTALDSNIVSAEAVTGLTDIAHRLAWRQS